MALDIMQGNEISNHNPLEKQRMIRKNGRQNYIGLIIFIEKHIVLVPIVQKPKKL